VPSAKEAGGAAGARPRGGRPAPARAWLAASAAAFSLKNTHTYSTSKQLVHTPNYVSARRLPSSRLSLRLPPTPEGAGKTGCLRPRHRLACCTTLVGQTRGHYHAAGLVHRSCCSLLRCAAAAASSRRDASLGASQASQRLTAVGTASIRRCSAIHSGRRAPLDLRP
jgi:hypothetical protein